MWGGGGEGREGGEWAEGEGGRDGMGGDGMERQKDRQSRDAMQVIIRKGDIDFLSFLLSFFFPKRVKKNKEIPTTDSPDSHAQP